MSIPLPTARTLKGQFTKSWLILAGAAIIASFTVASSIAWQGHRNELLRIRDDLTGKAVPAARRVSSEMLIGHKGSVETVIGTLKADFQVAFMKVLPPHVSCSASESDICKDLRASYVWVEEKIPYLVSDQNLVLAQPKAPFLHALNPALMVIATLPVLLLFGAGLLLQRAFLRRNVLEPIGVLLETGGNPEQPSNWPTELQMLSEKLRRLLAERDRAMKDSQVLRAKIALADLSERILHDLKSPIGTLDLMIENELKGTATETKDAFRRVLGRIRGIVNLNFQQYSPECLVAGSIDAKEKEDEAEVSSSLLGAIRTILEEVRPKADQRSVELVADLPKSAADTFVPVHFSELCRAISNIVVNAMEAAEQGEKKVFVSLRTATSTVELSIRDYGKGFDAEALARITGGERHTTKRSGGGLGLQTSKNIIKAAHGELIIKNGPDGALVRIKLPCVDTPAWFYDITRVRNKQILALDDDVTIERRLGHLFGGLPVKLFQCEDDFLKVSQDATDALLLVDFDYGGRQNGIELIVTNNLNRRAVLVSGRIAFDSVIRLSAQRYGIRMYPKECLS